MDHPTPSSRFVGTSNCTHLRHKGMYVTSVPDADEPGLYGGYDATAYWCTRTMKGIGPDGQPVRPDLCRVGSDRGCCSG